MASSIPVEQEVADLVHAVNRRIRDATYRDLGPMGITPAQGRALRVLGRAGRPMRMSELAERLRIARRSATAVIDDLVACGLVERQDDPDDRRAVVVGPTHAGSSVLAELAGRRRLAAVSVVGRLPRQDLTTLRDLLRRLDTD